jgi:hypothetical protein
MKRNSPAQPELWAHRTERIASLHDTIREACLKARYFLEQRSDGRKPRRVKRRVTAGAAVRTRRT